MNQSFFIGAVGAHQQLKRLTVHSNNIANVNTYGFKAEKSRFTALMYDNIRAIDNEMLPSGVGAALWATDTDYSPGAVATTERNQDYMIEGDGFFAVVDLATSQVSLTRNGAFAISELQRPGSDVDEDGVPIMETVYYLSDNQGRFVLSRSGGMIEVDDQTAELPVGVFDYINYNGMEHIDGTRFMAVDKNGGIQLSENRAMRGMLEQSNADLAEELSKVIETQRAYGMALKMVLTSDEIETTINSLNS